MNLYNLTNIIKDICSAQPNVAQVEVGDVYAINHKQDIEYPAMVVTQQTSFVDNINKTTTYNFTIFYIDLLDSDESNMLDVQSIATVALNDVMEAIEGAGILLSDTYEQNTFKERFNDVCAGAFVRVGIIVDNETCEGDDYNLVYSVNGESGDVWLEFPDVSNYYTKSEVNSLVDSATSGLPTPQEFIELEEELESKADSTALTSVYQSLTSHTSDTSIHLTSGAVQTQINNSISGKADASVVSALTEEVAANSYNIGELQDAMGDMALDSEVVHKGLTETITGNKTFSSDTTFDGLVTLLGEEAVIIGNESLEDILQEKLDVTAYTPTDLSEYWTSAQTSSAITSATTNMQTTTNMTQSITSGSTTTQYPSASAVYGVIPKFELNNGILNIIVP